MAPTSLNGGKHRNRASLQRTAISRTPSVSVEPQLLTTSSALNETIKGSGNGFMSGAANSTRRVMKAVEEYRRAIELVHRTRRNRTSFPRSSSPKRGIDLGILASANPKFDPVGAKLEAEVAKAKRVEAKVEVVAAPKKSKSGKKKKKKSKKRISAFTDGVDVDAAQVPIMIPKEASEEMEQSDCFSAPQKVEEVNQSESTQYWDDPMLDMGFDLHDGSGPFKLEKSPVKTAEEIENERRASLEEDMRRVSEQMCEWDYWWDWYISALATGEMQEVDHVDVPVSVCNMTTFNTALLEQDNELNPTHPTHLKRDSLTGAAEKLKNKSAGEATGTGEVRKKSVRWSNELVSFDSSSTLLSDEFDGEDSNKIRWANELTTEIVYDAASDTSSDSGDSFMDSLHLQFEEMRNMKSEPSDDSESIISVSSMMSYQSLVSVESNEDSQLSLSSDTSSNSTSSDASSPSVGQESRKALNRAASRASKGPVRRAWAAKKDSGKAARAAARSGARKESVLHHIKHSHGRKSKVQMGGFEEAIAKLHETPIESNDKPKTKMMAVKSAFRRLYSKPKIARERQSSLVSI